MKKLLIISMTLLCLHSISAKAVDINVKYSKTQPYYKFQVDETTTFGNLKNTIGDKLGIPSKDLELALLSEMPNEEVSVIFNDNDKIREKIPYEINLRSGKITGFKYIILIKITSDIDNHFRTIKAKTILNNPLPSQVNSTENKDPYGGQAGREFFQSYTKILLQTLPKTLAYIRFKATTDNWQRSNYLEALNNIFDILGAERKYIAEQNNTFNSNDAAFGVRFTSYGEIMAGITGAIIDPINEVSFPAWYKMVNEQAKIFLSTQGDGILRTAPVYARPFMIGECEKLFDLPKADFAGSARIEVCVPEKLGAPLKMACHHSSLEKWEEQEILDLFIKALHWNEKDQKELKEWLGLLLLKISHTSIYQRGQAAITEWLLRALADMHGFNLIWSEKWQGPSNPNPDMHALSATKVETFLEEFQANTTLKSSVSNITALIHPLLSFQKVWSFSIVADAYYDRC